MYTSFNLIFHVNEFAKDFEESFLFKVQEHQNHLILTQVKHKRQSEI
jgi:hypothetical protein